MVISIIVFLVFLVVRRLREDPKLLSNHTSFIISLPIIVLKINKYKITFPQTNQYWAKKGFLDSNWLTILFKTKEDEMMELQGPELCQHLRMLKYMSIFFFVIMILNFAYLLPVYITGHPIDGQTVAKFQQITILNIQGITGKIWVSVASIFTNTIGVTVLLFLFASRCMRTFLKNEKGENLTEFDKKRRTILLSGIPKHLDPKEAN